MSRYCNRSKCGRGCTKEEHDAAVRGSTELCAQLGSGWTPRVWENLGWHYEAVSPGGWLKVSGCNGSYIALLGPAYDPAGHWSGHGTTPEMAIRNCLEAAQEQLQIFANCIMDARDSIPSDVLTAAIPMLTKASTP